ncbi:MULTISPECIES: DUF6197 family protein [unclassified Streptomyces]|uniref:DUF6197 family protein n=1 Tax=unclassified Streptomyces TaxID=2593676 RepID=UPI001BE738A1|nr:MULTISPECIES: DUF6197 family protein [unclassified Streptomyces]MBT2406775.1 hypothetical protein [Streptomyces sp. ISL-21]MBT2610395.1 hypothetical protein [Streptomyces sp. ISL-87]
MPRRKGPAAPARILTVAADHIERVGLYQGDHLWQPGRMGDTAPCTVLHAWERGVRAARPRWSVRGEPWDIFQRALFDSLVVLSNHINGRPVSGVRWRNLRLTEDAYRRTMLWCWGGGPERTTAEAAAIIRTAAALYPSGADHMIPGCPILQNVV